uniref:Uncharacterized protein n=1 Tax=Plectus sambesii TaxID=2011161 RepID=A0A914X8L9_9BILA
MENPLLLASKNVPTSTVNNSHLADTYNNQNNQGRSVGGPVNGGIVNQGDTYNHSKNDSKIVVQGDQHIYLHDVRHPPTTSSPNIPQPITEDWQQVLKT